MTPHRPRPTTQQLGERVAASWQLYQDAVRVAEDLDSLAHVRAAKAKEVRLRRYLELLRKYEHAKSKDRLFPPTSYAERTDR